MKGKRDLVLAISCFMTAFLLLMAWNRSQDERLAARIAPEIIRFHVLANSDRQTDQQLKLEVRSLLLNVIYDRLGGNATREETCTYVETNRELLEEEAERYMRSKGFDYSAHMELTDCYFPAKTYGDMTFPEGTYEAVNVTIGRGEGHNWWCVLYPPLCFVDAAYAVVPDASREELQKTLAPGDYDALLDGRPPVRRVRIKSKLLESLTASKR